MGWQNVFHCEKDRFCQSILQHYWPEVDSIDDIKIFDAKKYKGKIDIITGGFPCQPFSLAGKRQGTADNRYLWPDMLRIIREVRPSWVVGENVYGLINWSEGLVFEQVQSDLEAEGYKVAAYVLPAAGINAPHQRYRVWIVACHSRYAAARRKKAHSNAAGDGRHFPELCGKTESRRRRRRRGQSDRICETQLVQACPHADGNGCQRCDSTHAQHPSQAGQHAQCDTQPVGVDDEGGGEEQPSGDWHDWPTQSPLCSGDDRLPTELDGITLPKWKAHSLKLYGNAVVPQLALRIFQAIQAYEQTKVKKERV
jgi:DNA (cytosine-5)-methyltransferase 1